MAAKAFSQGGGGSPDSRPSPPLPRLCLCLVTGTGAKILHTILSGDEMECRVEADNLMLQLKVERERNSQVHPIFRTLVNSLTSPVYPGEGGK